MSRLCEDRFTPAFRERLFRLCVYNYRLMTLRDTEDNHTLLRFLVTLL